MFPTRKILFLLFALLSVGSCSDHYSLETCLRKDSISCLQIHIYKKIQTLLSQQTINLLAGFRIVKETSNKSAEVDGTNVVNDEKFEMAEIGDRQIILENLVFKKLINFFKHRKIEWNVTSAVEQVAPIAKSLFSTIPKRVQRKIGNYPIEGRGKKEEVQNVYGDTSRYQDKMHAYHEFLRIQSGHDSQKALVMSIIALVMSIIIAVKKHSETIKGEKGSHYEIHGETLHSVPIFPVGWSSGASINSAQDPYDSYGSQQAPAHFMAYTAQKPNF